MSIYNIFTNMVKSAKNTTIVRSLKATGHVSPDMIKMPLAMAKRLVEELKLNMSSRTLGNLFARKPPTYNLFHPKAITKEVSPKESNKREGDHVGNGGPDKRTRGDVDTKKKVFGSIVNKTGKPLVLPEGLKTKACKGFLDTEGYCKYKKACNFSHKYFPKEYAPEDIVVIKKWVEETNGLSFHSSISFDAVSP